MDRSVLEVKKGFPWGALVMVAVCAPIGGFALAHGYGIMRLKAYQPPPTAAERILAEVESAAAPGRPAKPAFSPALEYQKYDGVLTTLRSCARTSPAGGYAQKAKMYEGRQSHIADGFRAAYYDQWSDEFAQNMADFEAYSDSVDTPLRVATQIATGRALKGYEAALALDTSMSSLGGTALADTDDPAACADFAKRVSFGEFDLRQW